MEYPPIRADPRRRWRLAVRPPPSPSRGRKPEGRQSPKGHELVEDVRRRIQREYCRPPAARSQGITNRNNTLTQCNTED